MTLSVQAKSMFLSKFAIAFFVLFFISTSSFSQLVYFRYVKNVSCKGGNDGSLIASVSPSQSPHLYWWTNSVGDTIDTDSIVTGLTAGTYKVEGYTGGFTTFSGTTTITEPNVLNIGGPTAKTPECNGDTNGWASIDGTSGGTKPYSFKWSNGDTDSITLNIGAGNYSVTVIDANGCKSESNFNVGENTKITIKTGQTNATCFGKNDGTAFVTASGGVPNAGSTYKYSWSTNFSETDQTSKESGLVKGTFTVTVRDFWLCTAKVNIIITEPTVLFVISDKKDASCPGGSDGIGYATPGGGTSPYYYKWQPNVIFDFDSFKVGLSAGNYTVTVSDFNNCRQSATVNITDPNDFVITFDSTDVSCYTFSDGSAKVSVTGGTQPYTYKWSNSETTQTISGLITDNYICSVTDSKSCIANNMVIINEPLEISIAIIAGSISCFGGSDGSLEANILGGTMPFTFKWNTGDTTALISNISSGTYKITVIDVNNCQEIQNPSIGQPPKINISQTMMTPVTCYGDSDGALAIKGTGGTGSLSYTWDIVLTGDTVKDLPAASYKVIAEDFFNCKDSATFSITSPDSINLEPTVTEVSCFGKSDGSISISAFGGNGGYSYNWSTGSTDTLITNLAANAYTVSITDMFNCQNNIKVAVTAPTLMNIIRSSTNLLCFGENIGAANVSASGGTQPYTYKWNIGQTTANLSGIAAGLYVLTITDVNKCLDTVIFNITQPDRIVVSVTTSNDSICIGQNVNFTALATGGDSVYTFTWDGGLGTGASVTASPTTTTTYTVTVNDGNTCLGDTSAKVYVYSTLNIEIQGDSIICEGDSATYTAVATGGNGQYTYSWNTGSDSSSISDLPVTQTTYIVTLSDNCGNTPDKDTIDVDIVTINFGVDITSGCVPTTVTFTDSSKNAKFWNWKFGNGDWSNTQNTTYQFDTAGVYSIELIISGPNGCILSKKQESLIEVLAIPVTKFTYTPANPSVTDTVGFSNNTSNCSNCTWVWKFADDNDSTSLATRQYSNLVTPPAVSYNEPGTYDVMLIATNTANCSDTMIAQLSIGSSYAFLIPNAFSPNQDEDYLNEEFYGYGFGIKKYQLEIFNESGILVFKTVENNWSFTSTDNTNAIYEQKKHPIGEPWNGRFLNTGEYVGTGIYAFKVEITDFEGEQHLETGYVLVIR